MLTIVTNTVVLILSLAAVLINYLIYKKTKQKSYLWFSIILVYAAILRGVLVVDWCTGCDSAKLMSQLMLVFWIGFSGALMYLYKEIRDIMSGK